MAQDRLETQADIDNRIKLRRAGLRPTRQRLDLAGLLFRGEDRHVTAEQLHAEARAAGITVSVATIYNTLHQFTEAGLLREFAVDGSKTYFDTNTSPHHHFYCMRTRAMMDIPEHQIVVKRLPPAPPGMDIERIDVIVRVKARRR